MPSPTMRLDLPMQPRPDPCCGPTAPIDRTGVPDRRYRSAVATAPGPSGPDMMLAFRQVSADPLNFLRRARTEHGPLVQFPVPDLPTYLVDDAHTVRQVLMVRDEEFDKDTLQYQALAMVTGEGLLAAPHQMWREQRPVVQPAFHRRVLDRLIADTRAATQRQLQRWRQAPAGSVVDVDQAMMRIGMEVVGEHLFGADLRLTAPRLARATLHALEAVIDSVRLPWALLRGLPTPVQRRYRSAMAELDDAVADLIAERMQRPSAPRDDLLALLLAAYPEDPAIVRNQIITFLVAGHETVASALTWVFGLLAHHPAEQRRVQQELDEQRGSDPITLPDLDALPAVRACLDEAMRLYPPAWVITRAASVDTVLAGRAVPAGSLIIISPWLRHRDPVQWPMPDAFLPERFGSRPGAVARAATTRAEYLPFGTGQRLCIGRDVANVEGCVVLALLLREFAFEPVADRLPAVDPLVTLRPRGGLRLRLWPR
jgi:cytochrome P450